MAPKAAAAAPSSAASRSSPLLSAPLRTLAIAFIAWKALLLLLSHGGVLIGAADYDTSTSLFFALLRSDSPSPRSAGATLAARLTRWDAIYFVHGARVGYVYEQEWAFSPTLALALRWLAARTRALLSVPADKGEHLEALAGIALAHVAHGVAVYALYRLTMLLSNKNVRIALLASLLCIISPAGVFLSAPYAESPFSALSFVGVWTLAAGYRHPRGSLPRSVAVVAAGAVLGLATAVRSNGLASGLLFAVAALQAAGTFAQTPGVGPVIAAGAAGVGGVLVAAGIVIPQYVAYTIYCVGSEGSLRPVWCDKTVPSIYSHVQDVYW